MDPLMLRAALGQFTEPLQLLSRLAEHGHARLPEGLETEFQRVGVQAPAGAPLAGLVDQVWARASALALAAR